MLAHDLHHEGLSGGQVERVGDAVEGGEHGDVPVLDLSRAVEGGQREGLKHERALCQQEKASLADAIGERAGEEGQEEHGAELERADHAELEGRARQFEDDPRLPHALHPRTDERDELSGPEEAEVAMAEGAEPGGPGHRLYFATNTTAWVEVTHVFLRRPSRCAPVAAALLLGAALWVAKPSGTPAQDTRLAGQLLVALPELEGPVFAQTVIYMVRHDARSGLGLLGGNLADLRVGVRRAQERGVALVGQRDVVGVSVLHTDDYAGPDTVKVGSGVAITTDSSILQAITKGKGPRRTRFTVGFAGWAPGQLEAEMRAGYWVAVPSDAGILFDDAYDTKWDRAMAKRKISL